MLVRRFDLLYRPRADFFHTVPSLTDDRARVEEAMERSVRWLDRCIAHHEQSGRKSQQNLFAIVQGGLDSELRDRCLDQMIERKDRVAGYAIGGLSGGEAKGKFQVFKSACHRLTAYQTSFGGCTIVVFNALE